MKIKKFIKDGIHYIKETYPNGIIIIYQDPEFHEPGPDPVKPLLPDISTTDKKLDFIIDELQLKQKYKQ